MMIAAIKTSLSFLTLRQRVIFYLLVFARAFSSVLDVAGIALIGIITGIAASSLSAGKPLSVLGIEFSASNQQSLVVLVCIVLAVFALKAIIAVTLGKIIAVFLAKIESEKATEIANFLFSGDLASLQRFNKGEIVWASMGSATVAFSGLLTSLSTFISEGMLLLLVVATFFFIDPIASIFVIAYFTLLILIIQRVIGNALKKAGIDASEGSTKSVLALDDAVGAFREIVIFNKRQFYIQKFRESRYLVASSSGTMAFLSGMPRYVVETALMLGVVVFVGFQFLTGQLETGLVTVGVFLTGGVRIMASLLPLQTAIASSKTQVEQSRLAHQILTEARFENKISENEKGRNSSRELHALPQTPLAVEMKNLSYTYPGSDTPALRNVSLLIQPGQHVAFIGPSGAGKTTLADLILGLMEPTTGTLVVGGESSNHRTLIEKGLVSYVPQRPGIVSGSIAENVAIGTEISAIDNEKVLDALEAANLGDFVRNLPKGIFSSVGKQADALSGGQIQRLGLARALYANPKLLVLDEATSALDASSEAFISESLRNLGSDVTVIVIAHRLSTVQHSDVVFVVEDGSIPAFGSFEHLRKTVPMVAEYVKLMSFDEQE